MVATFRDPCKAPNTQDPTTSRSELANELHHVVVLDPCSWGGVAGGEGLANHGRAARFSQAPLLIAQL